MTQGRKGREEPEVLAMWSLGFTGKNLPERGKTELARFDSELHNLRTGRSPQKVVV